MSVPKVAAVIGAGTMGPGMAAVLARAGSEVRLYDISDEVLERAKGGYQMATGALERVEAASAPGGSVAFGNDLSKALAGAELVLEAIPEKLALKREVTAQLEDHLADDAIIASNTSGIPITQIATALKHPARFVGMHWSNPPHLIPMIEVIPGDKTSSETVAASVALVERIGYEAVVEKEVPGFVENRILYAIMREAVDLVDRGIIDADGMDRCVRWGIG
ncbi:MAG TPA: 3-hydroxyacyl-CoA dehydrogenase NAD-binding domain-containing protein, partial [Streptosporangiaceae bacterium]|nr:3-hydroxyacyl-CoA dehydrogenase NAD-binding domain-containing protein [Streptosporangiaceae bacterium]